MKATELRIGNIIETITTPIEWKMCFLKKKDFQIIQNEDKNIRGIELTEEWFIKLGFTKIVGQHSEAITYDYTHGKCYINMADQIISFRGNGNVDFTNINYVHQLQNLFFAVTGEELQYTQAGGV